MLHHKHGVLALRCFPLLFECLCKKLTTLQFVHIHWTEAFIILLILLCRYPTWSMLNASCLICPTCSWYTTSMVFQGLLCNTHATSVLLVCHNPTAGLSQSYCWSVTTLLLVCHNPTAGLSQSYCWSVTTFTAGLSHPSCWSQQNPLHEHNFPDNLQW